MDYTNYAKTEEKKLTKEDKETIFAVIAGTGLIVGTALLMSRANRKAKILGAQAEKDKKALEAIVTIGSDLTNMMNTADDTGVKAKHIFNIVDWYGPSQGARFKVTVKKI